MITLYASRAVRVIKDADEYVVQTYADGRWQDSMSFADADDAESFAAHIDIGDEHNATAPTGAN